VKALLKATNKSPTDPTNRRDITLADQIGKTFGANVRTVVAPMLNQSLVASQHGGGLHAGACDLAHLAARAMAGIAETKSTCLMMLMVDVKAAFEVVQKALTSPCLSARHTSLQHSLASDSPTRKLQTP
jgi:hypothetical protein